MLRHRAPGATLLELLVSCALMATLLGAVSLPTRGLVEALAVRSARDALASGVARTRAAAVSRGGAVLILDLESGGYRTFSAAGELLWEEPDLTDGGRLKIAVDGAPTERLELRFDALGIGRLSNRTIRLTRGRAEAGITISAYGRVRVW